jgi:hypothetical protein
MTVYAFGAGALDPNAEGTLFTKFGYASEFGLEDVAIPATQASYPRGWLDGPGRMLTAR